MLKVNQAKLREKLFFIGLALFLCLSADPAFAARRIVVPVRWPPIFINRPPRVGSITPSVGISNPDQAVKFATTYSDGDGWKNIQYVYLLINTSAKGTNCFYGYYNQNENKLYLRNDADTAWIGGYAPGSANTIENSYARLNCASTTVSGIGNILTANWSVTFKPAFSGAKSAYLYVKDDHGAYQNWVKKGTWTIKPSSDSTAPTGSIKINNDTAYTNLTAVTLNLSAQDNTGGSGLSQMRFSNNNSNWSTAEAYAVTKAWTLSGSGTKTVYVKFSDKAGNWSAAYSDTIILDTTAPGTPSVTDDGSTTASPTQLHARWSSSDTASGIIEYQYKITQDTTTGTTIVDWTSTGTANEVTKTGLSLINGKSYYFSLKAKNGAGLWSSIGYSNGIKVVGPSDTTAPTGSIKINNDAAYTNTTAVTLNLSAQDNTGGSGLDKMKFSNNNSSWSTAEAYAVTKAWTLSSATGTKTVYVKFSDKAGNWSSIYSDTIILDTTPAATPSVTDDGSTTGSATQLHAAWSSSDSGSDIAEYQYKITQDSNTGTIIVDWTSTGTTNNVTKTGLSLTPGKTYYFSIKAKNNAGLWSAIGYSDGIKVVLGPDITPPTGSIKINNGATYANSTSVTLNLSALDAESGLDGMSFSNDNLTWPAPEAYSVTKPWTFTTGDDTKIVYVKFKDKAGNWSEVYSAGIILDTAPPVSSDSGIDGLWHNNPVSITLTASDPITPPNSACSGISKIYYSTDGTAPNIVYVEPFTLTAEGDYTVKYYSVDNAGNIEAVKTAVNQVKIDKTAPTNCSIIINNNEKTAGLGDAVTLSLSAEDSASGMGTGSQMQFSNDNTNWSNPENYAATKTWNLSGGLGTKTVYARFKDAAGNWSGSVSDTIEVAYVPKERIFIYLNGQRVAMEENGKKFFYHNDHLGGTNVVTDESGAQVKYLDYQPFGETKVEEGSLTVKKKFTGKELDEETGLYDYSARQYDAKIGRFISADTVDLDLNNPQSLNRYSYCLNNPLKFTDETGHTPMLLAALAIPGAREAIIIGGYLVLKWAVEQLRNPVLAFPKINLSFRLPGFSQETKPPPAVESPSVVDMQNKPEGMSYTEGLGTSVMSAKIKTYRHYGYAKDAKRFKDGLEPGAYATHAKGRPMKGETAEQKLSLEHSNPPDAYYKVKPESGTRIDGPSRVKPIPGRTGGGQEYKFPEGTGKGTVTGPYKLER